MNVTLPYGHGYLNAQLDDARIAGVITNKLDDYHCGAEEADLIARSLAEPIGSEPLEVLARGKQKVVLIASDHTRPVPSKLIVPQMLAQIRKGNPDAEITILIATGCHRGTTKEELIAKFGEEIVAKETIVIHDCTAQEDLVHMGTLPSGAELVVNKLAAQADLLVSEGFIEPHFFAGFSGGRKSVLPGIASRVTVYGNHCAEFIDSPCARAGILEGNPIHRDMIYAAQKVGLAFIVNVVINNTHRVIASFAGDCLRAHLAGAEFVKSLCASPAIPADIVLTTNNGYPLDQNIYQAVKGMCTAESTVNPGGVIIMAAECGDGCGGDSFYSTFANDPDAGHILDKIRQVPADQTIADQWQSQIFARILEKHRVILISQVPADIVTALHMIPAVSVEDALEKADAILGKPGTITVIPQGISSIIC